VGSNLTLFELMKEEKQPQFTYRFGGDQLIRLTFRVKEKQLNQVIRKDSIMEYALKKSEMADSHSIESIMQQVIDKEFQVFPPEKAAKPEVEPLSKRFES